MSHADYASEHQKLVDDLKKDGAKFKKNGEFIQVSYNSPFTMENRVNEVWIEMEEQNFYVCQDFLIFLLPN